MDMQLQTVDIHNPEGLNFIFGQSTFIRSVESLYEICFQHGSIKFGVAFCEASGPRLIRKEGNDDKLIELAVKNAENIACGHTFIIFLDKGFPIAILNSIKAVPEVARVFCATANPTKVVVASSSHSDGTPMRGVIGVLDGFASAGVETEKDAEDRKDFLRNIGYKIK